MNPAARQAVRPLSAKLRAAATLLVSAALLGMPAMAYGPKTASRMTDVSLRLAPVSLRAALLAYERELREGVAEGLNAKPESLDETIEREAQHIVDLYSKQVPWGKVAKGFGRLAGMVFLINDPLFNCEGGKFKGLREDYSAYIEKRLPKLILTFDGHDSPPIGPSISKYAEERAATMQRYRDALLVSYYEGGHRVSSDTFDDLSNAFGTAQLTLSHSVSDTAKIWYEVWASMNGDTSNTPFRGR